MPVETRYFRGDQHTINGLTAYVLGTAQTDTSTNIGALNDLEANMPSSVGVRVFVRHADGSEDELTDGTYNEIMVQRTHAGSGIQTVAWDCPETPLDPTDAIHLSVRVYVSRGTSTYADFVTEQLGATQLDAATWTFYLWTDNITSEPRHYTTAHFYWGDADHNSRIEGFSWSTAAPPPVARRFQGDGLTLIVS